MGWYALHTKHQTDKILSQADKISQSTPVHKKSLPATQTPPSQKYFTITQWGVKATYDGKLNLEYGLSNNGSSAYFSSSELDASDANCKANLNTRAGYGGLIQRELATDKFLLADGEDSGMTVEQYATTLQPSEYSHVDNYYYFFRHSQAACSDKSSSLQIEAVTNQAVSTIANNLQATH